MKRRRRLLSWVAVDGAAIAVLLAIASFIVIDSPLAGLLALVAAVVLFITFLILARGEDLEGEGAKPAAAEVEPESGLPVHTATGMHRWWVFRDRAVEEIARAQRQNRILAIVLVEPGDLIDAPTDEERARAAAVVRRTTRDGDYAAQLDDNRFVVMLPETDVDGARTAANRLLTGLRGAEDPRMKWRAALVHYPKHGSNPDELLDQAQGVLQPGRLESAMGAG